MLVVLLVNSRSAASQHESVVVVTGVLAGGQRRVGPAVGHQRAAGVGAGGGGADRPGRAAARPDGPELVAQVVREGVAPVHAYRDEINESSPSARGSTAAPINPDNESVRNVVNNTFKTTAKAKKGVVVGTDTVTKGNVKRARDGTACHRNQDFLNPPINHRYRKVMDFVGKGCRIISDKFD